MAGVKCVGHAMAMHLKHQAAAARGAALLCGSTETKTSKSLVEAIEAVGLASSSFGAVGTLGGTSREAATTEPRRTIK